jgi:hypothetical protein
MDNVMDTGTDGRWLSHAELAGIRRIATAA